MYLLAIRPPKKASVVSLIIITIGAAIFIRGIAGQELTKDYVYLPPFSGEDQ
jgi:branched-chain amino acid transport system permease protein